MGKNGSGKTTIIETLAMATTGTLPPNCRNGQAFINDPNIHGGVEVRARARRRSLGAAGGSRPVPRVGLGCSRTRRASS